MSEKRDPAAFPDPALADEEYASLAAFRHSLREFLAFSEDAAREAGLTPQQHQALLAVRGFGQGQGITVGDLAAHLLLKPHTIVELVDRLVRADLLLRAPDATDRRKVLLTLTPKAQEALNSLTSIHLAEIRRNAPRLVALLQRLAV